MGEGAPIKIKAKAKNIPAITRGHAISLAMQLRSLGLSANFSYKFAKLGKQLKEAAAQNARKCVIVAEEFKDNKLTVKDMATGEQELVDVGEFLSRFDSGGTSASIQ